MSCLSWAYCCQFEVTLGWLLNSKPTRATSWDSVSSGDSKNRAKQIVSSKSNRHCILAALASQAPIASCTFCICLGSEHTRVCYALSMTSCHTVLMNAKTSQLRFETVVRYEWLFLLINFSALIEANLIIKRDSIFSCHRTPICIKSILWVYWAAIWFFLNCLSDLWTWVS